MWKPVSASSRTLHMLAQQQQQLTRRYPRLSWDHRISPNPAEEGEGWKIPTGPIHAYAQYRNPTALGFHVFSFLGVILRKISISSEKYISPTVVPPGWGGGGACELLRGCGFFCWSSLVRSRLFKFAFSSPLCRFLDVLFCPP